MPYITKNLVSVSKFGQYNSVFFEFWPYHCLVKPHNKHDTLLKGVVQPDGLYKLQNMLKTPPQPSLVSSPSPITSLPAAYCNVTTSLPTKSALSDYTWHLRLGHSHPNVMNNMFQHCNIPLPNKDVIHFVMLVVLAIS